MLCAPPGQERGPIFSESSPANVLDFVSSFILQTFRSFCCQIVPCAFLGKDFCSTLRIRFDFLSKSTQFSINFSKAMISRVLPCHFVTSHKKQPRGTTAVLRATAPPIIKTGYPPDVANLSRDVSASNSRNLCIIWVDPCWPLVPPQVLKARGRDILPEGHVFLSDVCQCGASECSLRK